MKSDLTEYIFGNTTRSTVRDRHKQGLDNKDSIEIGGGDRRTANGGDKFLRLVNFRYYIIQIHMYIDII